MSWWCVSTLKLMAVSCLSAFGLLSVTMPTDVVFSDRGSLRADSARPAADGTCRLSLVESIPIGLFYNSTISHMSTYDAWKQLLDLTTSSVALATFYWTLLGSDVMPDPSAEQGEDIFRMIMETGRRSEVRMNIVQNWPDKKTSQETAMLVDKGAAEVRSMNFPHLVGGGILHTKMWLVDRLHFYVGSANMDYRSLTQVKELGVLALNCDQLADDMDKIFQVYWLLGGANASIPDVWPQRLHTKINRDHPLQLRLPDETLTVYLASSPPALCPPGRTSDIAAVLDVIGDARRFVYVAVMDYYPMLVYGRFSYWPVIDDALRTAAVDRRVEVRLLISLWNHTASDMYHGLRSLQALHGVRKHVSVQVRMFRVPESPGRAIPFSRVNHNKYMVTDRVAYVGTSNWSGDYFVNTGGIGFVMNCSDSSASTSIRAQLEAVFLRDWNSAHTVPVPPV